MRRLTRSAAFYVVLALLVLALAASVFNRGPGREKLTLSQFESAVAEKRVQTAEIIDGDDKVRGELRKVAWPTRPEVVNYSTVVLVTLILLILLILALDYAFAESVLFLFKS